MFAVLSPVKLSRKSDKKTWIIKKKNKKCGTQDLEQLSELAQHPNPAKASGKQLRRKSSVRGCFPQIPVPLKNHVPVKTFYYPRKDLETKKWIEISLQGDQLRVKNCKSTPLGLYVQQELKPLPLPDHPIMVFLPN